MSKWRDITRIFGSRSGNMSRVADSRMVDFSHGRDFSTIKPWRFVLIMWTGDLVCRIDNVRQATFVETGETEFEFMGS